LGDAVLISKMTAASLWTLRISGIKKTCYICVCLSALYATCYAWQYENTLSCDVATFTSFFVWICELELWQCIFVHLLFLCGMECFFAIAPLPVLQSHCDKIAITHMFVYATGFFCNRSTSAVCNHTVKDVCNHLYFHQVATTSSKDQSSRNHCFFTRVFLQLFFFFAKSLLWGCNHTAIRVQAITHILVLQLSCFCNCCTSAVATTCKECCNLLYIHQVATTSSKHQPSRNLTVSRHGAFFWTGFFAAALFLPVCLATVFLLQSQSNVFFATVFFFLQLHYAKGAITPRKGCNHSHAWFSNYFFCNRSTSVVATTL
jgi:hypothetical protein